jgi:hypothetical protein
MLSARVTLAPGPQASISLKGKRNHESEGGQEQLKKQKFCRATVLVCCRAERLSLI